MLKTDKSCPSTNQPENPVDPAMLDKLIRTSQMTSVYSHTPMTQAPMIDDKGGSKERVCKF